MPGRAEVCGGHALLGTAQEGCCQRRGHTLAQGTVIKTRGHQHEDRETDPKHTQEHINRDNEPLGHEERPSTHDTAVISRQGITCIKLTGSDLKPYTKINSKQIEDVHHSIVLKHPCQHG